MCSPATVSGWRVDVATQAKTVAEMNDPLAVFELTIGDKVRQFSGGSAAVPDPLVHRR